MKKINKMLYEAKLLEASRREYTRVCIIEHKHNKFKILGIEETFDTEEKAVQFCEDQAAGRPLSIIIMDIPRVPPHSERSVDLNAAENENTDRGSSDVAADIQHGPVRGA